MNCRAYQHVKLKISSFLYQHVFNGITRLALEFGSDLDHFLFIYDLMKHLQKYH